MSFLWTPATLESYLAVLVCREENGLINQLWIILSYLFKNVFFAHHYELCKSITYEFTS